MILGQMVKVIIAWFMHDHLIPVVHLSLCVCVHMYILVRLNHVCVCMYGASI